MDDAPFPITASEALNAIDRGALRPRDYMTTCLARMAAREPVIGAWCRHDATRARAQLQSDDDRAIRGLLRNIPVGVKDIIDVEGFRTGNGSPIYQSAPRAEHDATVVAMMRAAGAVIVGKTVSTELAGPTPAPGACTANPHNLAHTPGGSSSGSAAAVADGHVPIAIGTQTAGSVIRPASYCGVFGFKPTFGVVSRAGIKIQSETLDTVGVFARSLDDVARWYAAVTGARTAPSLEMPHSAPLRIAFLDHLAEAIEPAMAQTLSAAREALERAGEAVVTASLPADFAGIVAEQRVIQAAEMARRYETEHLHHRSALSAPLARLLDDGARTPRRAYMDAIARTDQLRARASSLFVDIDAWLLPSAPGAAPHGFASTGDPMFNRMVSLLHLPAINIPAFLAPGGLPLGLQLVCARGHDEQLLSVAAQVSQAFQAYLLTHPQH